jgi:stearoyl-CoA desaturase (delta-9 desaturase)
MTASFFGGVYTHSNAAHNLLSMMRIGVLDGGVEAVSQLEVSTPIQRFFISQKQDR